MGSGGVDIRGSSGRQALLLHLGPVADPPDAPHHVHNQQGGGQHEEGRHDEAPQARGDLVLGEPSRSDGVGSGEGVVARARSK